MAESVHDPLCAEYVRDWWPYRPCYCDLIAKVRTNERIRLISEEGWFAPEAHEAVVEVAKVRAVRHVLTELRREVDALERVTTHAGSRPEDVLYTVWLDDVLDLIDGSDGD